MGKIDSAPDTIYIKRQKSTGRWLNGYTCHLAGFLIEGLAISEKDAIEILKKQEKDARTYIEKLLSKDPGEDIEYVAFDIIERKQDVNL